MKNRNISLSIVIPLYNEEASLLELYKKILKNAKNYKYEIIFIDDGSTDNSYKNLLKIKKIDKNIKIIKFKKNYGKSYALDAGFKYSKGDLIVTMDADLQDDPDEIPNLIRAIQSQNIDIISGWKFKRHDPLSKTIPSKIFNFVIRFFTGLKLHDTNCGLKIYKKEAIQNLSLYGSLHRFIPVILGFQGYQTSEIRIRHFPRKYGRTKFGSSRFMVGLLDFFTVLFLMKFMKKPLHFFGFIGLAFVFLGTLLLAFITYLKIKYGSIQARLPLLNFGILGIIMGGQFFSIGLLGELLISKSLMKIDYNIEKIL